MRDRDLRLPAVLRRRNAREQVDMSHSVDDSDAADAVDVAQFACHTRLVGKQELDIDAPVPQRTVE